MNVKELNWNSQELSLPSANAFPTFYPPKTTIPGLEAGVRRIGGEALEVVLGYGSTFSGDATPTSLIDFIAIVRNTREFYYPISLGDEINLGTTRNPEFHIWCNRSNVNFYSGNMEVDGVKRGIKIGVIEHDEFLKHARGGMPFAMESGEGKGFLYLAGRLQKVALVPVVTNTNDVEKKQIDQAINQARIDGVWLTLGLMPEAFTYRQFAGKYVELSYLADRRVEKANKPKALLYGSYENYEAMLVPILAQFAQHGIISETESKEFEKLKSLPEDLVNKWLLEAKNYAFRVNFLQNPVTYGIGAGLSYGIAKVKRATGLI